MTATGNEAVKLSQLLTVKNDIDEDFEAANTSINDHSSKINTLREDVATNTSNISSLQGSVSTNAANISSLQSSVDTNTSDISTVQGNITTINSTLDSLQSQIDSIDTSGSGSSVSYPLSIENGGTGMTSSPSMLVNLASTSAANVLQASPRPGVTGTLPIAYGGTGNTTGTAAYATQLATARTIRTNLSSTSTASFNGTANITPGVTGVLPIAYGGTGATTAEEALSNLGISSSSSGSFFVMFNQAFSSASNLNCIGIRQTSSSYTLVTIIVRGYLSTNSFYSNGTATTDWLSFGPITSGYYPSSNITHTFPVVLSSSASVASTDELANPQPVTQIYINTSGYVYLYLPSSLTSFTYSGKTRMLIDTQITYYR